MKMLSHHSIKCKLGISLLVMFIFFIENPITTAASQPSDSSIQYIEELIPFNTERYIGNEGDSFIDVIGRRNGNMDVNGNIYPHGLTGAVVRWNYTDELSWVWNEYKIDKKFNYLQGKVVLIKSYNETDFDTKLEIVGDGKILFERDLTPENLPTEELKIDIKNVGALIIKLTDTRSAAGGTPKYKT